MNIGITGTTGFVGSHLMCRPYDAIVKVPINLRSSWQELPVWASLDCVVHLAGKPHQMQGAEESAYFEINTELTKQLALLAKNRGVKHFVFVSTVKVYNDELAYVNEKSPCKPSDAYGASKLAAERALLELQSPDFLVSIIRSPVVYGAGVKGNVASLIEFCRRWPVLPLGGIKNRRSMVAVENLCDMIMHIAMKRLPGLYIAGDASSYSTSYLVQQINTALGKRNHLISIPTVARNLLRKVAPSIHRRLFGSFEADCSVSFQKAKFVPTALFSEVVKNMVKQQ